MDSVRRSTHPIPSLDYRRRVFRLHRYRETLQNVRVDQAESKRECRKCGELPSYWQASLLEAGNLPQHPLKGQRYPQGLGRDSSATYYWYVYNA